MASYNLCRGPGSQAEDSSAMMTAASALKFIESEGAVFVAAKGEIPTLVDAIVGERIRGSWWAHPQSHEIYALLSTLEQSPELLMSRLLQGRVTVVHRRLWPALVRLHERFSAAQLARHYQEHSRSGKHVSRAVQYPVWVPEEVKAAARKLSEADAERLLREARVLHS